MKNLVRQTCFGTMLPLLWPLLWLATMTTLPTVRAGELPGEVVMVERAALRATPAPFADTLALLPYGTEVERLGVRGAWVRVAATGQDAGVVEGWLRVAELAPQSPDLRRGGSSPAPDTARRSVSLAGKGLLAKPKRPQKDFIEDGRKALDALESDDSLRVPPSQAGAFLAAGDGGEAK